ncbi:hypothetical protein B0J17DRAFT_709858 [Rhizoctonia solani]|nr:hypothetical protein B0J17DRAFT_709858 [Rhizoctonia solani]
MALRLGIRGTSLIHCTFYRESTAVYDVRNYVFSPYIYTCHLDHTSIAGIEWSRIGRWRSKVTIEGQAGILDNIAPRAGAFTQYAIRDWRLKCDKKVLRCRSREYHSTNGKVLKWKIDGAGTLCITPDSNTQLAQYNGVSMTRAIESREASNLEIFDDGQDIQDAIIVTWVIMETMTRGQNPVSTPRVGNSELSGRGKSSRRVSSRRGDGGGGGGGGGDVGSWA